MNISQDESTTLNVFFNFLDSVELKAVQDNISIEVNKTGDLHGDVNNRISELEEELIGQEQKEKEVMDQLEHVKTAAIQEISDLKSKRNAKLNIQKEKFEEAIKKHQDLLKDLLKRKDELSKQYEQIEKQAETIRAEAQKRDKKIRGQVSLAYAQQKELAITNERIRQKKIIEKKTQEIKESIVNNELQPKLQNQIEEQKREIEELKQSQLESLQNAEKEAEKRIEIETRKQVEILEKERQTEFQIMKQNLQRQLEKERDLQNAELERLKLKLVCAENDKTESIQNAKEEAEALIQETREKWKSEIIKEQLKVSQEMKDIEARIQKMAETARDEAIKEAAIREERIHQELEAETRQKNEKKLQIVVQKLEEETNSIRKKLLEEAEIRINEAQQDAANNLQNLESEKNQQQDEINELTNQVENEKALCAKMESDHSSVLKLIENQRRKRDELIENIAISKKELDVAKENKNKRDQQKSIANSNKRELLKNQLNEAKEAFEKQKLIWSQERSQLDKSNKQELSTVSRKVKSLVEGKEQEIMTLKDQISNAEHKLREIENLFMQQKKVTENGKRF
ncbi:hypothetical protein M9Y10_021611 [Tritrichomonas musculus]|uniref:Uncharacterized protein n=1 Tax=Tritrichomonas musculus TaxID=1915356 RepID=A0ABR2KT83_9EUKA